MGTLADFRALRAELPLLGRCTYLNTGTAGPLPVAVADAMASAVEWERAGGRGDFSRFGAVVAMRQRARELVARLLSASADEVALVHHTSDGINVVLAGIDWHPGDEVVTTCLEHDAVAVPLGVLAARRGVEVRYVDLGQHDGAHEPFEQALSERTRLVVLSHVAYSTGAQLPVRQLTALARRAGAQVLVDGAQSCGALPVDVRQLGVDYYTLSAQKWLCGPEGMGALFVRADRIESLWPAYSSYFSAQHHDFRGSVVLHASARRFETGMLHRPALAGFVASLEWMLESVDVARGWQRAGQLVDRLRAGLTRLDGVALVTPAAQSSTLVSFDLPAYSPARLNALTVRWAEQDRLILRSIDHPPYALRASVGFFSTEAEIDALVGAVADALRQGPAAVSPERAWHALPDHRSPDGG